MVSSSSDPRRVPGGIAGPGGPHDRAGVVLDTRHGILLEECFVSTIDDSRGRPAGLAMLLSGRINRTQDRARVLFLFDTDGAAAIVTELFALVGRSDFDTDQFKADVATRLQKLEDEGNLT